MHMLIKHKYAACKLTRTRPCCLVQHVHLILTFLYFAQLGTSDVDTRDVNYTHLFDIQPLTSVGLDTDVTKHRLKLVQGQTYHVLVVAVDESGACVETSAAFVVDTTPVLSGRIGVGPDYRLVRYHNMVLYIVVLSTFHSQSNAVV